MASATSGRTALWTAAALVAFAGNSILCRLALRGSAIDPLAFSALRLTSGALVLAPLLRVPRDERERSARGPLSAAALAAYAIFFSLAYLWLEAGTGALLLFGAVQTTMLTAGLRQGERPSPLRVVGMVAAAAGVVVLVLPGVSAPHPLGALLMVLAGVAWGLYSLLGRGARSPGRTTARNFALAAPIALLAWACRPGSAPITTTGVGLAVASGAVTSGLGYVIWYQALRGHSATSAAVVQLAVPVLAALGGVLLLGETPTARLLGAGALTLGGIAVALLARSRVRPP